jgi:hypothetical protein
MAAEWMLHTHRVFTTPGLTGLLELGWGVMAGRCLIKD